MTNANLAELKLYHHSIFGNDFFIALLPTDDKVFQALKSEKTSDQSLEKLLLTDTGFSNAEKLAEIAQAVCDRKKDAGSSVRVGADGLILGLYTSIFQNDFEAIMILRNADGSYAEMSANGSRCLAHALLNINNFDEITVNVLTGGGRRKVRIEKLEESSSALAKIGPIDVMSGPNIRPQVFKAVNQILGPIDNKQGRRIETASVGNPHLVIERGVGSVGYGQSVVSDNDLTKLSHTLSPFYRDGINIEVIAPLLTDNVSNAVAMAVHERGVGITRACGTGAAATAVFAWAWGLVDSAEIAVVMLGGTDKVSLITSLEKENSERFATVYQTAISEHLANYTFNTSPHFANISKEHCV